MIALNEQSSPKESSKALRLAVFDCDGTLVDSAHSIVSCMQTACAAQGFAEPTPEQVRAMVGLPLEDAISRLYPDMESDTVMAVREGYRDVFSNLRQKGEVHEPLYHGTLDALSVLEKAGWLLGVATGKAMRGLVATLKTHDIEERFVTLQTADISHGKPNPDMLYKAMAETGVDASATVMIGDTSFDMEMARNAGTLAIGVSWGYHEVEELTGAGAHRVVETYDQLPGVIESLMGAGR
ncbi:MAG: HAD-IA family hydrolase [Rhodospirillaceae bacterium]|jgi:phosphoglycolate phosphatase|nr:HAD-IA family hydrolase [Rhodospirillaceae bacterium]MBT5244835.1 HAD-IA family hydrolase [Rhodospirillaceae bacterium]MBT5563615.1 HAD-IA family hydrolase [Rhodospirillaceae bacterium]MBT6241446.1 HAD-IA family hydrolase [Rhodospirillaceae bacterium]MBT7138851.1 HAD-IA family hydrolase [Rhodospirillaceae bacterium]